MQQRSIRKSYDHLENSHFLKPKSWFSSATNQFFHESNHKYPMRKTKNYLNKIIVKSLFITLLLKSCDGRNPAIDVGHPITKKSVQTSHLLQEQAHGKQTESLLLNKQQPINNPTEQITTSLYQATPNRHAYPTIGQLGIKGGDKQKNNQKKNKNKENGACKQSISQQKKATSCQKGEKEKANESKQKIKIIKKANKIDDQRLDFPDPKELYTVQIQNTSSDDKSIKELFKKALILTLQNDNSNNNHLKEALILFSKAANQGCIPAMYQIGSICEKQQNMNLAIRWLSLAFQNSWFINPGQAYISPAYNKLKELMTQGNNELNNLLLLYPNIDSLLKKWTRLDVLLEFYRYGTAEPYLNIEENKLKIERVNQEQNSIVSNMSQEEYNEMNRIMEDFEKAQHYDSRKDYVNAKKHYLKCQESPEAQYALGVLYQNGYGTKRGEPKYKKAVKFFEKAKTASAFVNLGACYMDGLIGKIDNNPDYQKAIYYLELSGHPDALCNLGLLFKERYVDTLSNQPNYQKAQTYFERSGTPNAHAYLGDLYYEGSIGRNSPYPDHEQAKYHYGILAEQGDPDALIVLGELHILGHVGKIKNKPNYQLGVKYYQEALTMPTISVRGKSIAHHNLGIVYLGGHVGLKEGKRDYQKAIQHFKQAKLPESYYHLGKLYFKGHIKSCKKHNKLAYNYKKAIKYYELSRLPEAKLEILRLYQENFLSCLEEKKVRIITEITDLLPTLPPSKRFYIQGIKEYYCGEWENALASLQHAILWGINEKDAPKIIQEIEDYLEKREEKHEAVQKELADEVKIESNLDQSSILAPSLEESIQNEKQEVSPITASEPIINSSPDKKICLKPKSNQARKQQKKLRRAARIKLEFLKNHIKRFECIQEISIPIEFEFLDESHKKQFLTFQEREENKKLTEVLEDIQSTNYKASGVGKPEVLKYLFQGYKGCLSRRLNDKDRLVYKPIGKGKILILSWEGHYK